MRRLTLCAMCLCLSRTHRKDKMRPRLMDFSHQFTWKESSQKRKCRHSSMLSLHSRHLPVKIQNKIKLFVKRKNAICEWKYQLVRLSVANWLTFQLIDGDQLFFSRRREFGRLAHTFFQQSKLITTITAPSNRVTTITIKRWKERKGRHLNNFQCNIIDLPEPWASV